MGYDGFLSYSQRDGQFVNWLQKQLEAYPLRKLGVEGLPEHLRLFRDSTDLAGAGVLSDTLRAALRESQKLIVVCSKDSAQSKWVDLEIRTFLQTHGREDVLAVYVNGQPYARDAMEECVPPALREAAQSGDDRDAEAYVIDATTSARRGDAVVRLIAGLTKQPLDAFRNRHKRYVAAQRQRLIAGGAALVAILGVLGASGIEMDRRNRLLAAAQNAPPGYARVRMIAEAAAPRGAILPEINGERIASMLRHPDLRVALARPVSFVSDVNVDSGGIRFDADNAFAVPMRKELGFELLVYDTRHAGEPRRVQFTPPEGQDFSWIADRAYDAPRSRAENALLLQFNVHQRAPANWVEGLPQSCHYAIVNAQGEATTFDRVPAAAGPFADGGDQQRACPHYILAGRADILLEQPLVLMETANPYNPGQRPDRGFGPDASRLRLTTLDGELVREVRAVDFGFAEFVIIEGSHSAVLVDYDRGRLARFDLIAMSINGPVIDLAPCPLAPGNGGFHVPQRNCYVTYGGGRIVSYRGPEDQVFDLQTGRTVERPEPSENGYYDLRGDTALINEGNGSLRVGRLNDEGRFDWRDVTDAGTRWRTTADFDPGLLWLEPMDALRLFCSYDMVGVQAVTPGGDFSRIERPCQRRGLLALFG